MLSTVERVIGGAGDDRLVGNGVANTMEGGPGRDTLMGGRGDDVLIGGPGSDRIFVSLELQPLPLRLAPGVPRGANQIDLTQGATVRAGDGNDFIDSRNGLLDGVDCAPGFDHVLADLVDAIFVGCESIARFALDDGPPAGIVGQRVALSRGAAALPLACPRRARIACRGTVTMRAGKARGRVLARARYAIPLGARRTLRLRLLGRAPARGAKVNVATVERGVSRVGPRGITATLLVDGTVVR